MTRGVHLSPSSTVTFGYHRFQISQLEDSLTSRVKNERLEALVIELNCYLSIKNELRYFCGPLSPGTDHLS
jgi:hypothetical protein